MIVKTTELAIRTVSEANAREHWRKRAKRVAGQRAMVRLAMGPNRNPPRPPMIIHLTRIAPRRMDDDNLQRSFKAVRDGVADWLGLDDGSRSLGWLYFQEKGKPKTYGIRIEIDAIAAKTGT